MEAMLLRLMADVVKDKTMRGFDVRRFINMA
jgi:hypothetical protein